jgi:ribosomal protein S18 acetylase RimI-like enzyme
MALMPPLLKKYCFREADLDLPEVQSFYCGRERWELEVSTWIKSRTGPNSVLEDIHQFGIEVWLHRTDDGELVGFSSLGENTWSIPMPKGPKCLINYIPYIGVAKHFQSKPEGADRDDKYAYQILDELIEYAAAKTAIRGDLHPLIGLSVDSGNKKAIRFYEHRDFVNVMTPRKAKDTGVVYERMLLNIASLIVPPAPRPSGLSPS